MFDISAEVAGSPFYLRLVFDDDTTGTNPCWAWYWRVDDITVYGF